MKFIAIMHDEGRLYDLNKALKLLKDENFDIDMKIYNVFDINKDRTLISDAVKDVKSADAVLIAFHGCFTDMRHGDDFLDNIEKLPLYYHSSIPEELPNFLEMTTLSTEEYTLLAKYYETGGANNIKEFIKLFSNITTKTNYPIEDIEIRPTIGIYYKKQLNEEEIKKYLEKTYKTDKNVIAIGTHFPGIRRNDTKHIDYMIEAIEKRGDFPICIYGNLGIENGEGLYPAMKEYLLKNGKSIADAIILIFGFSLSSFHTGEYKDFYKTCFETFNVPAFQGMTTAFSLEEYLEDPAGMDIVYLTLNIYQPEMDGQIISVPIATTEKELIEGIEVSRFKPMKERMDLLAELASRHADLRRMDNKDKKVAIVFHNYPPRDDNIGSAHGLDTPESVYLLLKKLKETGYDLELPYENGQEIIKALLEKGTNDWTWRNEEEILSGKVDSLSKEDYQEFYEDFEEKNKIELKRRWGKSPGTSMMIGDEMIIPGLLDNNVFIGLQPKRSPGEDESEGYHSLDNPPPYSYMGFYKWLDEIFKANAVIHIGTHGTLEWLPGKEVGLSKDSYPDMNIYAVPHFYIYNLSILGEGMQARRRSHAAILNHMIPSMDDSGTYDYLEELESLLQKLDHAKNTSPAQVDSLYSEIYQLAKDEEILRDLRINDEEFEKDKDKVILKIHNWIHELKNSLTRDGLHIYSKVPEEKRFKQLIKNLVMADQGGTKSLQDAILIALGAEPDEIRKGLQDTEGDNVENYEIWEKANNLAIKIIDKLYENDFEIEDKDKFLEEFDLNSRNIELKRTIKFIEEEVYPRLMRIDEEIDYFDIGFKGGFIEPGLGGSPTRGNIKLLPTGRNFYSIDPNEIPSPQAYETGVRVGDSQLDLYLKEKGKYPTNIGIIVYSGNTMKTYGEDVGEILYLMGVRPRYLKGTQRVIGVEVIPLEELGRPRVDATLRISGLFRDTFPNLINLMDDAVNAVAFLDEPDELNPIKKNVNEQIKKFTSQGISTDEARDRATVRVFSAPAGTYGAGVSELIESKKWETKDDLANAYLEWSSHGYSSKYHGEKMNDEFKNVLSKTTMTIKNEVSREIDLLDSDDFYNYHGGLIAAVEYASGEKPISVVANTANQKFVSTMTLNKETARLMRTRILNPKWLEGLKEHGYKGAQEVSNAVDIIFGWDAVAENIEDWMYDGIVEKFIFDEETLKWLQESNPTAPYQIAERLLEAEQRDMWDANPEDLEKLKKMYLSLESMLEGD